MKPNTTPPRQGEQDQVPAQVDQSKRIRIVSCSFSDRWYEDRIGQIFEVIREDNWGYRVNPSPEAAPDVVYRLDAEVLSVSVDEELLACPFCGNDPRFVEIDMSDSGPSSYVYNIVCDACEYRWSDYRKTAMIERWNRRPAPSIDAETLATPIDLILFCPACGLQHVDKAEPDVCELCGHHRANHFIGDCSENDGCADCVSNGAFAPCSGFTAWLNPPHKSHREKTALSTGEQINEAGEARMTDNERLQINKSIFRALGNEGCYHVWLNDIIRAEWEIGKPRARETVCENENNCIECGENIFGSMGGWNIPQEMPDYCSLLDLCALAEAEVERRGLAERYAYKLTETLRAAYSDSDVEKMGEWACVFKTLTANAEVRATALAAVLGGEE